MRPFVLYVPVKILTKAVLGYTIDSRKSYRRDGPGRAPGGVRRMLIVRESMKHAV